MSGRGRCRHIVELQNVSNYVHRWINVIGVVVEFSMPRKSSGTDYCMIMKVVDQSPQATELCVNVFMKSIDKLPHFRSRNDIILLCDVKIDLYNRNYYAVFYEKVSSFAVFERGAVGAFNPFQASTTFHSADSDRDCVRRLRNLSTDSLSDSGANEHVTLLKDFKEGEFVDLVCLVLHVYEVSSMWILFVWDGTDAPVLSIRTIFDHQNPLALQIEPNPLPVNVLSNFPHVGTVLRVVVDKAYEKLDDYIEHLKGWVRIRNLLVKTYSGLWKGILMQTTKIRPLSEKDHNVIKRLSDFDERIAKQGRLPAMSSNMPNFMTDVPENNHVDFASLMDLLTVPLDTGGFRCIVRMVEVHPTLAKDFESSNGHYRMRLTLEDPTARIHALLTSEDADTFFGGHLPLDILATKMYKLLGVPESRDSPRNPPWTECCIGFHSNDENNILGSRHFHICNTKLIE